MGKRPKQDGVGQLVLPMVFPEGRASDGTEETEDNGSEASPAAPAVRRRPERQGKGYSLVDKVSALPNRQRAWQPVAANGGAGGRDGRTMARFAENADERLADLAADRRAKTYRPQPVRRVFLPKSGGGQRPRGIPSIRDRIVQQARRPILEPLFEGKVSQHRHGFRPEKGGAPALSGVDPAIQGGYQWGVDADRQAVFDTVAHEKWLAALHEEIAEGSGLRLVRPILKAGVGLPATATVEPPELGPPPGGPRSPWLANVDWHQFDLRMVQAGDGLVR